MRHGKVEGTYARKVDPAKAAAGRAMHDAVEDAKRCAKCGRSRREAGIVTMISWDSKDYCSVACVKNN